MREEVYDYLRNYGFSKEELRSFEDINDNIFFANLKEINKNIDFLTNKGLTKEEIIYIFKKNCFMITEKDNRLEALDNIYINDLGLSNNLIKEIIINNPDTYSISPIELNKIINYLKENNFDKNKIINLIMKNPKIITLDYEEFIKLIKGV